MRNAKSGGDGGAAINGSLWDVMKTSPCIQAAETLPIPMDLNTSSGNRAAPVWQNCHLLNLRKVTVKGVLPRNADTETGKNWGKEQENILLGGK